MKKTIAFDFDGVIHRYSKGWQDGSIYDIPVEGIKMALDQLRDEGYEIILYSTRNSSEDGIQAVKAWLEKYDIVVDGISAEKPIAMMYVDDRAVPFNGNVRTLINDIHNFKVWGDKARKICPICNKEFFDDRIFIHSRKVYCSMECRIVANIEKEKSERRDNI